MRAETIQWKTYHATTEASGYYNSISIGLPSKNSGGFC